jgi:hypothetical protein
MSKQKDRLAQGTARTETKFKDVPELILLMSFDSTVEIVSPLCGDLHSCVNCISIVTWRFLKNELAKFIPYPHTLCFDGAQK